MIAIVVEQMVAKSVVGTMPAGSVDPAAALLAVAALVAVFRFNVGVIPLLAAAAACGLALHAAGLVAV